jgi:endoplasmic reticulum-Golgi intermediate compartment protein 3
VLPSGAGVQVARGEMDAFLQRLKRLDAYPKVNEDFYKWTLSGGIVTLVATVVMLLLFISETSK